MEGFCDCDTITKNFNEMISFFLKMYSKFIKIKGKDITNKKSFINMRNDYDVLISLTKSLVPKGKECIELIKECSNNHSKEIKDIESKVNKVDELIEKINNHYEIIKKQIPQQDFDEEEEEIEENKINIINDNNKPIEEMSEKEILEKDKKTVIIIQDLLKDEEYKRKNNEQKKEIIKVKNNVNDIIKEMEIQLNKDDEIIDHVEEKVDEGLNKVEKGNDQNLKKAAETAVKKRRLKYQLGLGAAFCAAGTIVPGIGNIVGGALGGLIGYGLYRIDKHRLKKIEKKYQEQNKDNK